MEKFLLLGAVGTAVWGAIFDLRGGRIPNWLTYGGIVSALAVRTAFFGWSSLLAGIAGVFTGGGIFFLLFLLGGIGGGDTKLMAAVGAWAGMSRSMELLVATAIAGGCLAVGAMVTRGRVTVTLSNTLELIRHHMTAGLQPHPELNIRQPGTLRISYGLAIAIGALYCLGRAFSRG